MVPEWGGISERPLAPDRTERSRFPPRVRLQATLLGIQMGELEVASAGGAGRVRALVLRHGWMKERVMARLLGGLLQLAPLAPWERLLWRLDPGEQRLSRLARALEFRPASSASDAILFERSLVDG
jgi:hypothetical protein